MLCRKVEVVPIECIARGYITGSGWKDYQTHRVGVRHPVAERAAQRRSAARTDLHAVNESREGSRREHQLRSGQRRSSARIDALAARHDARLIQARRRLMRCSAESFLPTRNSSSDASRAGPTPLLVDEIFTPDSSRFWPADAVAPGRGATEFRQAVRARLSGNVGEGRPVGQDAPGPDVAGQMSCKTAWRDISRHTVA